MWATMTHAIHKDPAVAKWLFPAYALMAAGTVLVFTNRFAFNA